jgi:hypothetical protein
MPNEPNEHSGAAPEPELVQEIDLNHFRKFPDLVYIRS